MGELRDRMENDLIIRGLSPNTQRSYLTAVNGLAKHYRRRQISPLDRLPLPAAAIEHP